MVKTNKNYSQYLSKIDFLSKKYVNNFAWTCFILVAMAVCLGCISLYFGASVYVLPMFLSYFQVPWLAILNIFPIVLLIFFFYFIFNKCWISFAVTSVIVLGASLVDYFKMMFRNDPFIAADISLFSEAVKISERYALSFNWQMICVLIACILGTLFAVFFVKGRINQVRNRIIAVIIVVIIGWLSVTQIYFNDSIYRAVDNKPVQKIYTISPWSATHKFVIRGFVYPFLHSIKTASFPKPEGYNEEETASLLDQYQYYDIEEEKKVNIISIMLEAYSDFSRFDQIEFAIDVYEDFHQLAEQSYSGNLLTNVFAANTINTERTFLTGCYSIPDFRSSANSFAVYLAEQGYLIEGSHPSYSWFYNRQNVNEYLGFDQYYFYDGYYENLTESPVADDVLFAEILSLYEKARQSAQPYFSFSVTYQNHGPYSSQKITDVEYVVDQGYSEEDYNILNNYFSGIADTTEQIGGLIEYLRNDDQPVVVILFGDHMPWMGDGNSVYNMLGIDFDLDTKQGFYNYYCTPYIIWANDAAKIALDNDFIGKGEDISPCFLLNQYFALGGIMGNQFMQLSAECLNNITMVHSSGAYLENGEFTSVLSTDSAVMVDKYKNAAYYWLKNKRR